MALNFPRLQDISSSLMSHKRSGKSFHTTFVYHGSKMLKIGINNYDKQHKASKYGNYLPTRENSCNYSAGIHSEVSAIIKLGMEDCSHLTFINIRIDGNGKPAMSKPCLNCQRVLLQVGYRNLWYFDGTKYLKH